MCSYLGYQGRLISMLPAVLFLALTQTMIYFYTSIFLYLVKLLREPFQCVVLQTLR